MELAGEGALMALLERRKRAFAAEGLFDEARKKTLPFMPKTIGVVTSPTGAVIRDILHRIEDRYPAHVMVWPALMQGKSCASEVARAIDGFNAMDKSGPAPRPDVLIIARGGGSIEDLWGFNEEIVVRAAASSAIPLISAIGHETDWTLLDYIADYRAPTPTAAAEMAVPVRADLVTTNDDYGLRLRRALSRTAEQARMGLNAARLPRPQSWLGPHQQRLDIAAAKLPSLLRLTDPAAQKLGALTSRLKPALMNGQDRRESQLCNIASRLTPHLMTQRLSALSAKVTSAGSLLSAYSYQGVLARGYALVTDGAGHVVRDGETLSAGDSVTLTFKDDVKRGAKITDGAPPPPPKPSAPKKRKPKKTDTKQMGLF
jgi:exodeoxyribonuclease VII large subunit